MKKQKKKVSKFDKWFLLTWKKTAIAIFIFILSVILHNLVYALLVNFFSQEWDEPFFFIVAVILVPLYLIISFSYSLVVMIKRNEFKKIKKQSIISIILGIVIGYSAVYFSQFFNEGNFVFGIFASIFFSVVVYYIIEGIKRLRR